MTNKEYDQLVEILGTSCKTYDIVTKKLAKSLEYKKMDKFEKWKEYLSEVVHQHVIWRNEVQKVLNSTKQGKAEHERMMANLHACPDEEENRGSMKEIEE
jgi:hypothetical protein